MKLLYRTGDYAFIIGAKGKLFVTPDCRQAGFLHEGGCKKFAIPLLPTEASAEVGLAP